SVDLALDIAELAPDDPFVQRRVAGLETLAAADQRARLEQVLRHALARAPGDPALLMPLTDCLLDQLKLDDAAPYSAALDALRLEGRDAVTPGVLRGRYLLARGHVREAAELLDAIEQRWGSHPALREYRMLAHDALGHGALALS